MKNRARGYEKNETHYVNANFIDMSVPYFAGSYSIVEDLYLWDQALYSNQLLRKENMELLFTKHISPGGSYYYGYDWNIDEKPLGNTTERIATVGHGGGIDGFNTQLTRFRSNAIAPILYEFVNPDDGASLVFDTKNRNAITMVLFGRMKFKKIL